MKRTIQVMIILLLTASAGCGGRTERGGVLPSFSEPRAITHGPKQHFFGYFGINPWDGTGRYHLALETEVYDREPTAEDTALVGIVDTEKDEFVPVAETRAWNFQQGSMMHWLAHSPDSLMVYNDLRNGRFVSVVLNVHSRKERVLARPVAAVSRDGRWAASLNYARLNVTRPGYGYPGDGGDPLLDQAYPEEDGLFVIDLDSGESELIVSLAQIQALTPVPEEHEGPNLWFNHVLISKDDSRIFFMARSHKPDGRRVTAAFTVNPDGSDLRCILPYTWGASHYDWLSGDKLMVTTFYDGKLMGHVLFTDGRQDHIILAAGILTKDGHGTFSPDGRWMATDTYPDALHYRTLLLMDMDMHAVMPLGRFFVPEGHYSGPIRCDLHPRWNSSGTRLSLDSIHDGSRQIYVIDLDLRR